mmetsp:Transcript_37376/g.83179  ORF Transcript_37376/g.83179 Transcript_37376/m.83179 type:complete len:249 (-) Transcript_37376:780-1526(-)
MLLLSSSQAAIKETGVLVYICVLAGTGDLSMVDRVALVARSQHSLQRCVGLLDSTQPGDHCHHPLLLAVCVKAIQHKCLFATVLKLCCKRQRWYEVQARQMLAPPVWFCRPGDIKAECPRLHLSHSFRGDPAAIVRWKQSCKQLVVCSTVTLCCDQLDIDQILELNADHHIRWFGRLLLQHIQLHCQWMHLVGVVLGRRNGRESLSLTRRLYIVSRLSSCCASGLIIRIGKSLASKCFSLLHLTMYSD